MDVCIGWLGKVHDAHVFSNLDIYKREYKAHCYLTGRRRYLECRYVCYMLAYLLYCLTCTLQAPLLILGDSAYPALPWLMKLYPLNPHTTAEQQNFNYHQNRACIVVENAFRRLKGRWRCLLKRLDMQVDNATTTVGACVLLNNINFVSCSEIIAQKTGNKSIWMKMMLHQCNMIAALDKMHQPHVCY